MYTEYTVVEFINAPTCFGAIAQSSESEQQVL